MNNTILTIKDLRYHFFLASGVSKAVDGVSFSLKQGQIMGIVGESGSGKSVTASSIMGSLAKNTGKVVNGQIIFNGKDIHKISHKELVALRGQEISLISQDPMTSLDPVFKIGDQMVELIRTHTGYTQQQAWDRAIDMLKQVGISEPESRMHFYPHELSGGMCQRVIIAMAISCDPKLIIADEPTTALDVTVQSQILKLLKKLRKEINVSILLITHNLGIVWEMCDNVMVMYAGKVVEHATMEELYKKPIHPYTWGLLDSIPRLSEKPKATLKAIPGGPPDLRLTGNCCNFSNRCHYAIDQCKQSTPELLEIEPDHFVACHRQKKSHTLTRNGIISDE